MRLRWRIIILFPLLYIHESKSDFCILLVLLCRVFRCLIPQLLEMLEFCPYKDGVNALWACLILYFMHYGRVYRQGNRLMVYKNLVELLPRFYDVEYSMI